MKRAPALPQPPAARRQRIMGLELLRCVATAGIIFLHFVTGGGFVDAVGVNLTPESFLTVFLTLCASTAVNVYGLISGYVLVDSAFKLRRWFALWFQAAATAIALCAAFSVLRPGSVTAKNWFSAFLPLSQRTFWYYSAYAGLYILTPMLNRALQAMCKKSLTALSFGILIVFCVLSFLDRGIQQEDPFALLGGYSLLWLMCLYILGATLRKTQPFRTVRTGVLVGLSFLCILLSQAIQHASVYPALTVLSRLRTACFLNPLLVAASIFFVEIFSRIRTGKVADRLIAFFAPLTLGVYFWHTHTLPFSQLKNRAAVLAELPSVVSVAALLGAVLALYLGCALLEWLRQQLFRLCRVDRWCAFLEKTTVALFERIYSLIDKAD